MKNMKRVLGCVVVVAVFCLQSQVSLAANVKIAIIDMKQVLATSKAGKKAQGVIEKKMKSLQESFQKDEKELAKMQDEMKKKGAAWSDKVKKEKAIAFQQKRRDMLETREKANREMQALREENINPILKKLEDIVDDVASDKGYTLVLPRNVVLYSAKSIDITDTIVSKLNKAMR
ncbi:OmpH family outer membrane protein [Desulfobulbus rhabdoformis]|nr:OmpH family outer membrane protein [Desulfobulbus rhabdoformis]